ncbi:hypothetical protein [Microvirga soli]|uniref:hypothetical protein n=1 Tax=Microvirga soli TaxID=1854496 RepID=UPI00191FC8EF|nr:hypothetical protein [Microvirga soli]
MYEIDIAGDIRRSLQRSTPSGVCRSELLQALYGDPERSEVERLQADKLKAEIALKLADAEKKDAEAEKARAMTRALRMANHQKA